MNKLWKKITAIASGVLALFAGIIAFIFEHKKRKEVETKLQENKEKLQAAEAKYETKSKQDEAYVEYKKENEAVFNDAIRGNPDAVMQLMQNTSEAGKNRNKHK